MEEGKLGEDDLRILRQIWAEGKGGCSWCFVAALGTRVEGLGLGNREEVVTSYIFDGSQSFPVSSRFEENSSNQWKK